MGTYKFSYLSTKSRLVSILSHETSPHHHALRLKYLLYYNPRVTEFCLPFRFPIKFCSYFSSCHASYIPASPNPPSVPQLNNNR
jgi:hypothetical protein